MYSIGEGKNLENLLGLPLRAAIYLKMDMNTYSCMNK